MKDETTEVIAALASPLGAAKRGIVRLSGSEVHDVVERVFVPGDSTCDLSCIRRPQRVSGELWLPELFVPLPADLMFWPGKRSYTGQPMAEFHTIGSPPLLDALLEHLTTVGVRLAGRGEFTQRAFLAGRIDLVQAEAVLGVIDAADHVELEAALKQLGGGITSRLTDVKASILALLGDLEAGLDFVEEDIEFITTAEVVNRLTACSDVLSELTRQSSDRLPSGYRPRVMLMGLPNAGKSTLFNCLAQTSQAIVSPVAGTTRDYLTAVVRGSQISFELIDTAGREMADDLIMQDAQRLATEQSTHCDLILWCTAADLPQSVVETNRKFRTQAGTMSTAVLDVVTQADLLEEHAPDYASSSCSTEDIQRPQPVTVSARTGDCVNELLMTIEQSLATNQGARSDLVSATTVRCRDTLRQAAAAITGAIAAAESQAGDEIVAFELRAALHAIGVILGEVYTDDILDHIFSNFCIGK